MFYCEKGKKATWPPAIASEKQSIAATWSLVAELREAMTEKKTVPKVTEISARSILNKSKIFDYCVNPYIGCTLACVYCYARLFMGRYSGHKEPWGEFVDVKVNAPELLRRQLQRAKRGTVWLSSVCDPYQPAEARYALTRQCLKELLVRQFPVNVQTKSDLVLRDLDLLQEFEEGEVGFTIATGEERVAALFEPLASPIPQRLTALEKLHARGIKTFAFVGPLLPGNPEGLVRNLEGKVDHVFIDRMNYLGHLKGFYRAHGLLSAATDDFFEAQKGRLIAALHARGMAYTAVF